MSTAATASPSFQHSFPAVLPSSASSNSTVPTPTASVTSSPSILPFHRRQLPATPIHTSQLPIPTSTATYSPLSSGLPSPNFPSPIPLPAVLPSIPTSGGVAIGIGRGRSPAPSVSSSRQPSRQQSIRRLSSLSGAFSPIVGAAGGHGRRPSHAASTSAYPPQDLHDFSTIHEDILSEGDVIGVGDELHGEVIEVVSIPTSAPRPEQSPPAAHLEVVGKLGAGSYAVVYLVREIISRTLLERERPASPMDGDLSMMSDSSDESRPRYRYTYGREFAVKCLAKGNLSPEELDVQMFEARVHQSLPTHPNIVTLYRTLQTPSFLLLVLESVPGQDLFYFLEQSRDHAHFVPDSTPDPLSVQPSRTPSSRPLPPVPGSQLLSPTSPTTSNGLLGNALMISSTPPTPSLLSTLHPQHQFSYQRLRLITSMFSQMCDAVDACHSRGVSHRDIKPENFIVTEGVREGGGAERKVIVKLSDFGLATMLQESADVDCGSAPYMSYECRNNVAPTYATQPADVWSLGIVLINMLYHHNPWSDTATFATHTADYHRHSSLPSGAYPSSGGIQQQYVCPSFQAFLANPVQFFLQRFPSMTMPVADFLASRVFCILPRPNILDASGIPKYKNIGQRCTAREFGEWIKSLPLLMGQGSNFVGGMGMGAPAGAGPRGAPTQRMGSRLAVESWMNEEDDALHVPSATPVPARSTATLVVAEEPALAHAYSIPEGSKATTTMADILSTSPADAEAGGHSGPGEGDVDGDGQESLRSPSTKRRGKRGARRKDKSLPPSTPSQNPSFNSLLDLSAAAAVPPVPTAADVENLASEISRSTVPALRSSASRTSVTSGRSGRSGRSRLSTTERLVAKLPPPPSMAPPAPPVEGVTVRKYQELGRRISMEEQEAARGGSPRPPSVMSQTGSSVRSLPISVANSTGNASVSKQRKAPPSPPNLFSPLHHYRPDPPKGAPPKPPVAAPASSLAQQHPGAAAILSSQPALSTKKGWMGRFLSSNSTANSTTSSPPPAAHAAPGAHQSPATLSSAASRASMSNSSLASSTMESAARSGLLIRENSPVRTGPNGTIRAPSRVSVHKNPGMQWDSHEDDLAPRVNDLAVMPPPPSTTWKKNPPPGAQWSTAEDPSARPAPAARPPPVHGFISSAVAFNAEQGPSHRRKMDTNWRSSVMSNATTASSGANSIINSAGTLSSASSMYTRFSNSSVRSVSTTATSASAMSKWGAATEKAGAGADAPSWRTAVPPVTGVDSGFVGPEAPPRPRKAPMQKSNVKRMDGIPWELDELPRVYQPRVKGVLPDMSNKKPGYGQQQVRGQRSSPPLDPISEKNNSTSQSPPPSPDAYRSREGAASTTDLDPTFDSASTSTDPRASPDLKKQGPQKSQSHGFQKFSLFKPKQRD